MTRAATLNTDETTTSTGGRLVSVDGRSLPLTHATLKADARAGIIRVTLEQRFRNPHAEPLTVTYSLPLPADGAVSGFSFRLGDELIVGEVDTKQQARARFDDAVLSGKTAALLDQERSSLFTQQVGNVPPRTDVLCQVQIDQKLAWLPDGCWEWRFPTVVAPRYLGAGRVADAAKVTVDVADQALPVTLGLALTVRDRLVDGARPDSPSHALHTERSLARTEVSFADERGAGLDRDVVVRWRVAELKPGVAFDTYEKHGRRFGLVTLVPPAVEAKMPAVPRDLIVLLDTSGSMGGAPIDQARRVTAALVDSLTDADQLELIEFSNSARRWKRGSVNATAANRRDAQGWLSRLHASGGTEMRTGILEALAPLRPGAQRQVVLITDGLIGFESEVVEVIANHLPRGCRVHTIGVGSGVNRSLTQPSARAGRGLELIVGLGEDVEVTVKRLLARTTAPLVTNLEVHGASVASFAPARLPDLFGGAPAMFTVELVGSGPLTVAGDAAGFRFEETIVIVPAEHQGTPAVATLFAREKVEDLELAIASGGRRDELDQQIERLGLDFQISTRLTSWIAVSAGQTVDPRAPRRTETMPHNLAYGLSAEGVGLRPAMTMPASTLAGGLAPALRQVRASVPVARKGLADMLDDESGFSQGAAEEAENEKPEPERLRSAKTRGAPPMRREQAPAPSDAPVPPPAAPASPAKKKGGLFELARDLLGLDSKADAGKAEAAASASRGFKARIVRRAKGETIIELVIVGGGLDWAPGNEVQVELADGSLLTVKVVHDHTTAEGVHAEGLTLTLALATEVAAVHRVFVTSRGVTLLLDVR